MSTLKKASDVRKSRSPKKKHNTNDSAEHSNDVDDTKSPRKSKHSKPQIGDYRSEIKSPSRSPPRRSRERKHLQRRKPIGSPPRRIRRSSSAPRKSSPRSPRSPKLSPRSRERNRFPTLSSQKKEQRRSPTSPSGFQVYHSKKGKNQVVLDADSELARKLSRTKL
jgi:hypothetical protein